MKGLPIGARSLLLSLASLAGVVALGLTLFRLIGIPIVEAVPPDRINVAGEGSYVIELLSLPGKGRGWTVADNSIRSNFAPILIRENGRELIRLMNDTPLNIPGTYRYDPSWTLKFSSGASSIGEIVVAYTAVPRFSLISSATVFAVVFAVLAFARPLWAIAGALFRPETPEVPTDTAMPFDRIGQWLALRPIKIAGSIAVPLWLAGWMTLYNMPGPFDLTASDFAPGAAARLGIIVFPPDALFTDLFSTVPGIGALLHSEIARIFGGDLDFAAFLLSCSAIAATVSGAACVVWRLTASPFPVLFLAFLYPLGWFSYLIVGYPGVSWSVTAPTGLWAQGWAIFIWGLWFVFPRNGLLASIPFVLAGLLVSVHPVVGSILAAILFAELAFRFVRDSSARKAILRDGFFYALAFVCGAFPLFVSFLSKLDALTINNFNEELWWRLMLFRKPFHIFIWDSRDFARIAALMAIVAILWINLYRTFDRAQNSKLLATICVVVALCFVSYVAVALVPTPRLAGLVLSRSSFVLVHISVILLCVLPWGIWRWREHRGPRLILALGAILLAIITLPPWWAPSPMTTWIPMAMIVVLAMSGGLGVHLSAWRLPRWLRLSLPFVMLSLLGSIVYQATAVWVAQKASRTAFVQMDEIVPGVRRSEHELEWHRVKKWLLANTSSDAILLLPPCLAGYFSPGLPRVSIVSYAIIGSSVYNLGSTSKEADILRELFEVDLRALDRESIVRLKQEAGGVLELLDSRYLALTSDAARLRAVKRRYAALRYVVTTKIGGFLPDYCSTQRGISAPAALPYALETPNLVVLDLEGL